MHRDICNSEHAKTLTFLFIIRCAVSGDKCSSSLLCDGGIKVKVGGLNDGMKVPAITKIKFHTVSSLQPSVLFPKLFNVEVSSFKVLRFFPLADDLRFV